jgi:membrane protease YdiL (CAAX protease family)
MAALPAVCEECLFRGWVQSGFAGRADSRQRVAAAIVAQAALFAVFHLLPERMPQTFFLGLVLGWLTHASGSLLPAIVCHIAHNSMPLALLAAGLPRWALPASVGCLLLGVVLLTNGSRGRSRMEPLE